MKTFNLTSPELFHDEESIYKSLSGTIDMNGAYMKRNDLGIEYPIYLSLFDISDNIPVRFNIPEGDDFIELTDIIDRVNRSLGLCSRLGQILFDKLISVNKGFIHSEVYMNFITKKLEKNDKWSLENIDFMGNYDVISLMLKKGKCEIVNFDKLKIKYDIDSFRKTLFKFIADRNIYTHGILRFWTTRKRTIIEYKDKKEGIATKMYAFIDENILKSYVECYRDLWSFLDDLSRYAISNKNWELIKNNLMYNCQNQMYNNSEPNVHKIAKNR